MGSSGDGSTRDVEEDFLHGGDGEAVAAHPQRPLLSVQLPEQCREPGGKYRFQLIITMWIWDTSGSLKQRFGE